MYIYTLFKPSQAYFVWITRSWTGNGKPTWISSPPCQGCQGNKMQKIDLYKNCGMNSECRQAKLSEKLRITDFIFCLLTSTECEVDHQWLGKELPKNTCVETARALGANRVSSPSVLHLGSRPNGTARPIAQSKTMSKVAWIMLPTSPTGPFPQKDRAVLQLKVVKSLTWTWVLN